MCFPEFKAPDVPPVAEENGAQKEIGMEAERRKAAKRFGIGDTWLSQSKTMGNSGQASAAGTRLKKNLGD